VWPSGLQCASAVPVTGIESHLTRAETTASGPSGLNILGLQAVLRSFAATGRAPEQGILAEAARPFDTAQVLVELANGDFLCLDQAGHISAAYPFSAAPTPHKVQIAGGASAFAMCAIDALGVAEMLRASVAIRTVSDWAGPSAAVCCEYINFFARHSAAAAWATAHPGVTGGIVSQDRALEVGEQIFGMRRGWNQLRLLSPRYIGVIPDFRRVGRR
jgi:Alkylmercury lyase